MAGIKNPYIYQHLPRGANKTLRDVELTPFSNHLAPFGRSRYTYRNKSTLNQRARGPFTVAQLEQTWNIVEKTTDLYISVHTATSPSKTNYDTYHHHPSNIFEVDGGPTWHVNWRASKPFQTPRIWASKLRIGKIRPPHFFSEKKHVEKKDNSVLNKNKNKQ